MSTDRSSSAHTELVKGRVLVGAARRVTARPAAAIPTQNQLTAHTAKAVVLSCMDFRLIDDQVKLLNSLGYNNNYDALILAGASLGYNQNTYLAWRETINTHIELAESLHHIHEIIVIDHMSCGAYRLLLNGGTPLTREEEYAMHLEQFVLFKEKMAEEYPDIPVRVFLMEVSGVISYSA